VREGEAVIGYVSVRVKPAREEIAAAEELYRRMREGTLRGARLQRGCVVPTGLRGLWHRVRAMRVSTRLTVALAACALAPGVVWLLGAPAWVEALAALTVASVGWWWLHLQVARPLSGILPMVERLASGDLRVRLAPGRVDGGRVDEFADIYRAITQMAVNVGATVQDVVRQVQDAHVAVAQIAAGNQDLSARTESTAASLQQTAASMEQIATTTRNTADAAQRAAQQSSAADAAARDTGASVGEAAQTMQEIAEASRRIKEIVGTIDGIAFQTNILALNAAVEAARAGESGRGFAVVAGEVRQLANRAGAAARDIQALIQDSAQRVERGARAVDSARQRMDALLGQLHQASVAMGEIRAIAEQQAAGIGQVNEAVTALDKNTQQNAAMVEQVAAAAGSLRELAGKLVAAVAVFRVDGGVAANEAFARPAPKAAA
jgi:aerotaxis receptor